jgi:hypothetical protein
VKQVLTHAADTLSEAFGVTYCEVAATGLEQQSKPGKKPGMPDPGGAESGAPTVGTFSDALSFISKLSLTDIEKAEAVRRLLASTGGASSVG